MFVRILAVLLVAGVLLAAGVTVYRIGLTQGYAQGAALAEGETPQLDPGYRGYPGFGPGYGRGFGPFGFGFFPFFPLLGCFFGLLFLFAIGGLFRGAFFGARYWHSHPPAGGAPPGETGPESQPPAGNP